MRKILSATVVVAALGVAPAAHAGTLSQPQVCGGGFYNTECTPVADYSAAAGEVNDVTLSQLIRPTLTLGSLLDLRQAFAVVTDAASPVRTNLPCLPLSQNSGMCSLGIYTNQATDPRGGSNAIRVQGPAPRLALGDRNDHAVLTVQGFADLGAGDDRGEAGDAAGGIATGLFGGPGNDVLSTTARDISTLSGDDGDDVLTATGGPVFLDGGAGDDLVQASTAGVVQTNMLSGADRFVGGAEQDFVNTGVTRLGPDGAVDTVTCGAGDDSVVAGPEDVVAPDCEHVQIVQP